MAVYGGKPIRGQIEHLRQGAEVVVGTPGRVLDLIDRRALNLAAIEHVVLDEADRMLDIGFRPDIEEDPPPLPPIALNTAPVGHRSTAGRTAQPDLCLRPEMLDFSPKDVAVETIGWILATRLDPAEPAFPL